MAGHQTIDIPLRPLSAAAAGVENDMHTATAATAATSTTSSWSTASFGDDAQTSPMELSALGSHLHQCKGASGRLFAARCAADSMHGFVAPRLVTTLVLAALLMGVSAFLA